MTRFRLRLPLDRPILIMLCFGFASGLPLPLSGLTLRQWMSEGHVTLGLIGLTSSLGLSYSLKFLWSPLLDRSAPGSFAAIGRRRGWLLLIQPALIAAIVALAWSDPVHQVGLAMLAAGLIAFLSASQDIVIDAWRIETFPIDRQGVALAAYVWGYRFALLLGGAGVIAMASPLGWRTAILVAGSAGLIGIATTIIASEPVSTRVTARDNNWLHTLKNAFAAPLGEFLSRPGIGLVLTYIALYKLGEAMAGVMLTPFYRFLGFDRAVVALASGPASIIASICGYAGGSWIITRMGLGRALILTGFGQMAAMAMYLALALSAGNHEMLVGTAIVESLVEGLADAAFLSFLSGLCAPAYTATQYALLSSVATLPLRLMGGPAGKLAGTVGWLPFYSICMTASLPAILVMTVIVRRGQMLPMTSNRNAHPQFHDTVAGNSEELGSTDGIAGHD